MLQKEKKLEDVLKKVFVGDLEAVGCFSPHLSTTLLTCPLVVVIVVFGLWLKSLSSRGLVTGLEWYF